MTSPLCWLLQIVCDLWSCQSRLITLFICDNIHSLHSLHAPVECLVGQFIKYNLNSNLIIDLSSGYHSLMSILSIESHFLCKVFCVFITHVVYITHWINYSILWSTSWIEILSIVAHCRFKEGGNMLDTHPLKIFKRWHFLYALEMAQISFEISKILLKQEGDIPLGYSRWNMPLTREKQLVIVPWYEVFCLRLQISTMQSFSWMSESMVVVQKEGQRQACDQYQWLG